MPENTTKMKTIVEEKPGVLFPNLIPSQNPAVSAFETNDAEASKLFHRRITDEPHKMNSIRATTKYVKNALSVAVSGITNSCIIIGAVGGVTLNSNTHEIGHYHLLDEDVLYSFILFLSLVIISANGVSTAYSDFLRRKEYKELYERERKREMWECENYIEGEEREMIDLYVQKGMSEDDAKVLVKTLSKDKEIFVNFMMLEELELLAPDNSVHPIINAIIIVFSSVIFGILPLLPYIGWFFIKAFSISVQVNYLYTLYSSYIIASLALFVCGVWKSHFNVTVWWISGLQMLFNGSLVFGVSYYIGSFLPPFPFNN